MIGRKQKYIHKIIYYPVQGLGILAFILGLFTLSCKEQSGELIHEEIPAYVDSLIDKVTEKRTSEGIHAAIRFIDSSRTYGGQKGVMPDYHYYWLYYDTYNRAGLRDSALMYVDSMLLLLENNGLTEQLPKRYIQSTYYKADLLLDQKKYNEAYPYYYKAQTYAEKFNDTCASSLYHFKLGVVLYHGELYKDACTYFQKSVDEIHTCAGDFTYFFREQQMLNNIGLCYYKMRDFDSAIIYYNRTLAFLDNGYNTVPQNKHRLINVAKAVVKGNMGEVFANLGDTAKAKQLYIESIEVNKDSRADYTDAQFTRIKLAQLSMVSDENTFLRLLDTVYAINDTQRNESVQARWHKAMWLYHDWKNEPAKAYPHLLAFKQFSDKTVSFKDQYSVMDIDNQVRTLKDHYEISFLKEKDDSNRLYIIIAIVICCGAVIIGILIAQNLRKSRRHVQLLTTLNEHINEQKTKLSDALKELEHAGKEKDRILKAVSHDMRSPINSALALIDILTTQSDNLDEEQKEYMALIKKSNENALNLTNDLLEVATLHTEQLQKAPVDITSVIHDRIKLLNYKAAEKGQSLVFHAPDNHITATVNQEKILRVVNNLVTNAIKFSSIGTTINISLDTDGDLFTLTIQDNGIGIPEKMKDSVFDLFSEAKRFGTSGEQPFGLGLSISKQIVEAHQGKIWFESTEGKGTTFYVAIPV